MFDARDRLRITRRQGVVCDATWGLGVFWMAPGILSREHSALVIRIGPYHIAFNLEVSRG